MLVAMVTLPGTPACATISDSRRASSGFAVSSSVGILRTLTTSELATFQPQQPANRRLTHMLEVLWRLRQMRRARWQKEGDAAPLVATESTSVRQIAPIRVEAMLDKFSFLNATSTDQNRTAAGLQEEGSADLRRRCCESRRRQGSRAHDSLLIVQQCQA
jgi:hypothetical protein